MTEVILLEDSGPLRRVLTQALREAGYNVAAFEDGVISSDVGVMSQADLLITDLSMPIVDGEEALRNIRETLPELRCVVISGKPESELSGLETSAVLRKPFEPDDLVSEVKKLLTPDALT